MLLAVPLMGCLADQKRKIAQCEAAHQRLYPLLSEQAPLLDLYTSSCMAEAGYRWTGETKTCRWTVNSQNPYCYEPTGFVGRLILRVELEIRGIY